MSYVDGFVIPIKKKNLKAYWKLARLGRRIWMDHGALEYRECVAEQLNVPCMGATFPRMAKLKAGETVLFSFIVYRSRAHRDQVNAKVMKDPRMIMPSQGMPFDVKRSACAGFKGVVEA